MLEKDSFTRHLTKLKRTKASVDNSLPLSCKQKRNKSKKHRLQEERYTEIERENRILLEKMIYRAQTPSMLRSTSNLARPPKSLNLGMRRREAANIARENAAIAKRLKARKPNYSFVQWEADRATVETRIKSIREHPSRSSAKPGLRSRDNSERPRRLVPLSKLLVYHKTTTVDGVMFDVSVFNDQIGVTITLDNVMKETYSLKLDYEDAMELMQSSDNWALLVDRLALDGDDVILVEEVKPRNAQTVARPMLHRLSREGSRARSRTLSNSVV